MVSACATGTHSIGEAAHAASGAAMLDAAIAGGSEATVTSLASCVVRRDVKAVSTRNHEPQKASRPFDSWPRRFCDGRGRGYPRARIAFGPCSGPGAPAFTANL